MFIFVPCSTTVNQMDNWEGNYRKAIVILAGTAISCLSSIISSSTTHIFFFYLSSQEGPSEIQNNEETVVGTTRFIKNHT
jgi:hypothetical protein